MLALAALSAVAPARNERAELEAVYRNLARAFAAKDIKGYIANWAPAIRWFPRASTTTLTKPRAQLIKELKVEFASKDKIAEDFTFFRFDTEPERATVDLFVLITHGAPGNTRTMSERHHWLKLGGRWWLSRIEAIN